MDGFKNYELREASTDRAITEEQLRGLIQESMEFNFLTPQKAIPSDHYIPPPPPKPRDLVPIVVPATLIPTVVLGLVLIPLLVSNAKAKTLRKHVELSPDYFKTVVRVYIYMHVGLCIHEHRLKPCLTISSSNMCIPYDRTMASLSPFAWVWHGWAW